VSQSIGDSHLSSLSLCSLTVCRSDLVFGCGLVCAASSHCVATVFFLTSQSPSRTMLVSLSLTSSTLRRLSCRHRCPPFPLNNVTPALVEQGTPCHTSPWHHKASNARLETGLCRFSPWPHRYETPPPSPPQSSSLRFFAPPQTKSQIEKQLHSSNRLCLDFLTDVLVMPHRQLGKKVTSRLRPCVET